MFIIVDFCSKIIVMNTVNKISTQINIRVNKEMNRKISIQFF